MDGGRWKQETVRAPHELALESEVELEQKVELELELEVEVEKERKGKGKEKENCWVSTATLRHCAHSTIHLPTHPSLQSQFMRLMDAVLDAY